MTPRDLVQRLLPVIVRFRTGTLVWHRANGKRGVICEYCVDGQGCVMLGVCWGAGDPWDKVMPDELSQVPVARDDDEGWKDTPTED